LDLVEQEHLQVPMFQQLLMELHPPLDRQFQLLVVEVEDLTKTLLAMEDREDLVEVVVVVEEAVREEVEQQGHQDKDMMAVEVPVLGQHMVLAAVVALVELDHLAILAVEEMVVLVFNFLQHLETQHHQ